MKRTFIFVVVACLLVLANTGVATLAYDNPGGVVPWVRGAPGTTWQAWDFLTPVTPYQPYASEATNNGLGAVPPAAVYEPGLGQQWEQIWGQMEGVLPLSGLLWLEIPNFPEQNPYKDIIIQLMWTNQTSIGRPEIVASSAFQQDVEAELLDEYMFGPTLMEPVPGVQEFWYVSTYRIRLEPNPVFETILISGSVAIDSVIVDTICIPEPATLAILGLGALTLLRKRK